MVLGTFESFELVELVADVRFRFPSEAGILKIVCLGFGNFRKLDVCSFPRMLNVLDKKKLW